MQEDRCPLRVAREFSLEAGKGKDATGEQKNRRVSTRHSQIVARIETDHPSSHRVPGRNRGRQDNSNDGAPTGEAEKKEREGTGARQGEIGIRRGAEERRD